MTTDPTPETRWTNADLAKIIGDVGTASVEAVRANTDELALFRQQADVSGQAIAGELAAQKATIAENTTAVNRLAGLIEQLLAGDEPHRALIGAATWDLADLAELEAVTGTLAVHRVFDSAGDWTATTGCRKGIASDIAAGRKSLASWAQYPTADQLETLRTTLPIGHHLSLACVHEVDRPGKPSPAEHGDRMQFVAGTVRSWGRPEITTRTVFTGYGGQVAPQRVRPYLTDQILTASDVISFDPYNTYLYHDQQKWTEPAEMLGPWHDLAVEYGFDAAIDETSCPEWPEGPARKVTDLRELIRLADLYGFLWVSYFDVEQGEISDGPDHRIKSSPEHLAAFAEYAAR